MIDGLPTLCEKGGQGGIFLPLFGDAELESPLVVRQIIYLVILLWCFSGVAILSDTFMQGIEAITSQTQEIVDSDGNFRHVPLWNDTIANLTLMALGSSAPEILLSLIEVFSNEMFSSELGPATIVGSAAFNLFLITALCIGALPTGEVRFIKDTNVYAVTTIFSLFAYLWMYSILAFTTPDLIEPWEGIVTFAMFPLLLFCAFAADRNWLPCSLGTPSTTFASAWNAITPERIAEIQAGIRQDTSRRVSEQTIRQFIQVSVRAAEWKSLSRMHYRCKTIRHMTAAKQMATMVTNDEAVTLRRGNRLSSAAEYIWDCFHPCATISFAQGLVAVIECMKRVEIKVIRVGSTLSSVKVDFCTQDGTAEAGSDYIAKNGVLEFAAGEVDKLISIDIVDDDAVETDEDFFVVLSNPRSVKAVGGDRVELGTFSQVRVLIIDDDDPGSLRFEAADITLQAGKVHDLIVRREGGVRGRITCRYRMEHIDGKESIDYVPTTGELVFDENTVTQTVPVTIKAGVQDESKFAVILEHIEGARVIEGRTEVISTVTICPTPCDDAKMLDLPELSPHESWSEQFTSAIYVNGSKDDQAFASRLDWVMHIFTVVWKVMAASVPPPNYCHGWLCFCISLLGIALITALINDFASFLGCVIDIPKYITAITIVAFGTSLPDTFASMTAAQQDRYADASIGNITGSNSVNVFLGIGLSWSCAAIYWSIVGRTAEWEEKCCLKNPALLATYEKGFIVVADSLWITIASYLACAVVSIILLAVRRVKCGGELGGPRKWRLVSIVAMVMLWVLYIFLSCSAPNW